MGEMTNVRFSCATYFVSFPNECLYIELTKAFIKENILKHFAKVIFIEHNHHISEQCGSGLSQLQKCQNSSMSTYKMSVLLKVCYLLLQEESERVRFLFKKHFYVIIIQRCSVKNTVMPSDNCLIYCTSNNICIQLKAPFPCNRKLEKNLSYSK